MFYFSSIHISVAILQMNRSEKFEKPWLQGRRIFRGSEKEALHKNVTDIFGGVPFIWRTRPTDVEPPPPQGVVMNSKFGYSRRSSFRLAEDGAGDVVRDARDEDRAYLRDAGWDTLRPLRY